MKSFLPRIIRIAAFTAVACMFAVEGGAQTASVDSKRFLNPNADFTQVGLSEERLGEAQNALASYDTTGDEKDLVVAVLLMTMAGYQNTLAQYERLLVLNQQMLNISERRYGPEHEITALSLTNLAHRNLSMTLRHLGTLI